MSITTATDLGKSQSRQIMAAVLVDDLTTHIANGTLPCPVVSTYICSELFEGIYYGSDEGSNQKVRLLRTLHPDVPRIIMHFLTAPRTKRAISDLASAGTRHSSHGCSTRCCVNPRIFEDARRDWTTRAPMFTLSPLERLLDAYATAMTAVIDSTFRTCSFKVLAHKGRSAVRHDHRVLPWPSRQHDVFPHGISSSLTALCAWTPVFRPWSILTLADVSYSLCASSAFPEILLRSIIPLILIPTLKCHLKLCMSTPARPVLYEKFLNDLAFVAWGPLSVMQQLTAQQIHSVLGNQLALLDPLLGLCVQACTWITEATPITANAQSLRPENFRAVYYSSALVLSNMFGRPTPPELHAIHASQHRQLLSLHARIRLDTSCHPMYEARAYIQFVLPGTRCANPGCVRIPFTLGRSTLRECKGCHLANYCSRTCQRVSWRHPYIPHRNHCKMLAKVVKELSAVLKKMPPYEVLNYSVLEAAVLGAELDQGVMTKFCKYWERTFMRADT